MTYQHPGITKHALQASPGFLSKQGWPKWSSIIGIWVLLGLIYAGPIYLETQAEKMNHSAVRIFSWGVLTWCAWAPLTPLMFWLARRYPLEGVAWKRALLAHVPTFLVISAIHSAAATVITLTVKPFDNMGTSPAAFWPRFLSRMTGAFGSDLLVYGAVVGVYYAINYYQKYREREFIATELQAQLAQAQLHSLKMQLQPHFLFNTLNGIVGLVRDNENKAAISMLVGLSDLLRHTLDHSNEQEVELEEELKSIDLYLKIQQMRFSDRLHVERQIALETTAAMVPNLFLQPLIENAIRHGIAKRASAGLVGIETLTADGFLKIKIYDDGVGLSNGWRLHKCEGIGLANTIARLQQLYDGNYEFDIRNRKDGGVEVLLSLPFHRNPAADSITDDRKDQNSDY